MPAMYAHKRFGKEVKTKLDPALQQIIKLCPYAFLVGLQGPDILFFYKPYRKNKVVSYGNRIHAESAYTFLKPALQTIRQHGIHSIQHAYLLGFLCHYTLDSACHPYVEDAIQYSGVLHMEIESEFEKFLLRKDGFNPFHYAFDQDIFINQEVIHAIAPFYSEITKQEVADSLKGMKRYKKWLMTPNMAKQYLYKAAMKASMHYRETKGLILDFHDNPKCKETNIALYHRYERGIDTAVQNIYDFEKSLQTDIPLPARFMKNFE